jgi:YVTN family beta-propeller protein
MNLSNVSIFRPVSLARFVPCRALALAIPLMLAGCAPHDFPQYPPNYREFAYVTNGSSNTVTVVDVVNVRVDREIAVGENPVAVAVNPHRNEIYVVNSGTANGQGSVSVINAENNTVAGAINVHRQPVSIEVDAAGELAYVANAGANVISVIDLKTRREIAAIGTGEEPASARLTPNGKTLVVANRKAGSVSVFDAAARSVRQVFEGCPGAADIVTLPDSSKAFIACSAGHQVMAIALARPESHPVQSPIVAAQPDRLEALLDVGQNPLQLALKPDGGEVFTVNALSNSTSEIVTGTDDVQGATTIGENPVRGLVSPDNALLYVANFRSQYVTVYSIDDGRRVGPSLHVGDGPSALALSSAGHLLFVVDKGSGDVAVVRTASRSLFTLLPAGRSPNAIAIKAFKVI